jgi:hypothetical protein
VFDQLEVELWDGEKYTLRESTKSVAKRLEAAATKLSELSDDAADDDQIGALLDFVDVMLEPVGDAPAARAVLWQRWEDDKLGIDWLGAFVQSLQEEAENRRRPTSATRTPS